MSFRRAIRAEVRRAQTGAGAESVAGRCVGVRRFARHLANDPAVIAHRAEPQDAAVALVGNDRMRVEAMRADPTRR